MSTKFISSTYLRLEKNFGKIQIILEFTIDCNQVFRYTIYMTIEERSLKTKNTLKDKAMKKSTVEKLTKVFGRKHENKDLVFEQININVIRSLKVQNRRRVHKSPNYNGRQSSEYHLVEIDGRFGYVRISNHWGTFFTTKSFVNENGDLDKKYVAHNWKLTNGKRRKDGEYVNTSQAGVIWMEQ